MDVVARHVTLPTALDEAWTLVTRPDELERWLGADVVLDPTPGSPGLVIDHDGTRRHLLVEDVAATGDTSRRLAWRWWDEDAEGRRGATSRVELTLVAVPGGTHLSVTEQLETPHGTGREALGSSQASMAASTAAWFDRLLCLEAMLLLDAVVRG